MQNCKEDWNEVIRMGESEKDLQKKLSKNLKPHNRFRRKTLLFLGYYLSDLKLGGYDVFHNEYEDHFLFTKKVNDKFEIQSTLFGENLDLTVDLPEIEDMRDDIYLCGGE